MRAIVIAEAGEPDVLEQREVPPPEPGGAEVRVRVHAAGMNRADLLQRRGLYPPPAGVDPSVPGLEYAGVVESAGPRATLRKPGERVMGLVGGAAYADYVVVHERETQRVPDGIELNTAAAFPEAFMTAYRALFLEGGLQTGQWCLIRAATSGVGMAGIQLCAALGARSFGTSRSAERLEPLYERGMTAGSSEAGDALAEAVRERSGGRGAAVVLDLLGGGHLAENLDALAEEGTMVVVGLMAGLEDRLSFAKLLMRRQTVRAMTMRSQPQETRIRLARITEERLGPLVADGTLVPGVDRVFALDEAADAHRYMESGGHQGKIVLEVAPER